MIKTDIAIVGGGPAGLCAAISAASQGANVTIIEKASNLGGQLIKQTHMFFGSQKQYASTRGIDIPDILMNELKKLGSLVNVMLDSTVLGLYEDGVLTVEQNNKYIKIKPDSIIIATGASEKFLAFPNNDLPGIYGAGAVQTLMNVHGIKPGNKVVMVGAGNIGLIVSYQLLQAGIEVKAIIDAAPKIGGYYVHASKVRRMGVPILTSHTVKYAHGKEVLKKVTIVKLDNNWQEVPGSEIDIDADVMCISVGLSPLAELLWQVGCDMIYVPELGGHVPVRNQELETSVKGVYVAGDVAGVEEASSAMVEGRLAGLCAAKNLGYAKENFEELKNDCIEQLYSLRSGPVGEKIRAGLSKVIV
ncbi:FAD-dependent pyridine nucleotide-disulfide oxidoreductase [Fervidicella metallireducens AeB]|uniref:FAD-dependent pyridine nucleotide-disulfide oxidoreductase n=1 Tax=Fervidicella metallireducens AeB TaxID=1403537 RepID=A0A017RTS9_9CLOT|nr:NAD(P)/FAD-dependent oxidoreductase [Fervidicella metallireducens]EYE87864.1 FAD-dependent pyridine nucleotide-disulfide oxidoreductase [Fervidicella metallireducens AeB]